MVNIVIGKEKITKIGLTITFKIPNTVAAINAVTQESM